MYVGCQVQFINCGFDYIYINICVRTYPHAPQYCMVTITFHDSIILELRTPFVSFEEILFIFGCCSLRVEDDDIPLPILIYFKKKKQRFFVLNF